MSDLSDAVPEFVSSEHFLFVDPDLKPHAEELLAHWTQLVGADLVPSSIERSFKQLAALDLPVDARKAAPRLVRIFLEYVASTGRMPQAAALVGMVESLESRYLNSFRADGSARGESFKKNYTDVGRNDPCPCGSGRKFKQCCMKLIS